MAMDAGTLGFSKKKGKIEKTGTRNTSVDSRELPIVPDDWMRMYGDLSNLIGFNNSYSGDSNLYQPNTNPNSLYGQTESDFLNNTQDKANQFGNMNLSELNGYNVGDGYSQLMAGGGFAPVNNENVAPMGVTQEQLDIYRQANIPEGDIFDLIPELKTQEEFDNYGEGMYFRDDEGVKMKKSSLSENSAFNYGDDSIPQMNRNDQSYNYAQDFADMDAERMAFDREMGNLGNSFRYGR
mgnify:CR=1 FL=1|tara:strand:+ start:99 stop:812 length:714 start_codon:yes stop_codon:yes gene_type:complete